MIKLSIAILVIIVITLCSSSRARDGYRNNRIFDKLHSDPFPQYPVRGDEVETLYIEQKLDHFNVNETRTWQMRYFANYKFLESGGPIFIYVGGEWEIQPGTLTGGHVYDMAQKFKAALFYTEHRFYGQSRPLPDLSDKSLAYLSVRQALADLADFIKYIRKTVDGLENSKVILIGGSYSGSMVTWFKRIYPNMVAGSWASSAPLQAQVDFMGYKYFMGESMKLVGEEACLERIGNGTSTLEYMLDNKKVAEVRAMLKLCDNFDELNDLDQMRLLYEISDLFAELIQTHTDRNIQDVCENIMAAEDGLTGVINFALSHFPDTECHDFSYESIVKKLKNTNYINHERQWFYQSCNEFGWFQTAVDNAFGSKYTDDYFSTMCYDVFGPKYTRKYMESRMSNTNKVYGGAYVLVKDVYMTYGELDPWRAIGLQRESKLTLIPMYSHCKDFESISEKDTPEMLAAKEKISNLIDAWLK